MVAFSALFLCVGGGGPKLRVSVRVSTKLLHPEP